MYRPLNSWYTLHHTHTIPSHPILTQLLQSSTTLELVPNTRLHLPLQLKSLSKQLSWLILNKAAVLAHPQQGVLLQCQGCCPGSSSKRCPSTCYPIFCVTGVSKSQLLVNILLLASMVTGRFLHSLHTVCKLRWL